MEIDLRQIPDEGLVLDGSYAGDIFAIEDEVTIAAASPPRYQLRAQVISDSLLVQGTVSADFTLISARSGEPFQHAVELVDYAHMEPLEGQTTIDLTPQIREDILLALPTYPLSPEEVDQEGDTLRQFEYIPPDPPDTPATPPSADDDKSDSGWKDGSNPDAWGALDDLET